MKLSEESASTSIYLEQIDNHINLSEGYSSVRQLLFKELNLLDGTNPSVDDRLYAVVEIELKASSKSWRRVWLRQWTSIRAKRPSERFRYDHIYTGHHGFINLRRRGNDSGHA